MSSQRKCPKCGHINKEDMPICTKCGGALPPQDEAELMRQTMGASYDVKWVVVGAVIILLLQFGTVALIWQIAGKEFLIGDPRRSLLEASIESVDDDYGHFKKSNEVKIIIKLDSEQVNTAPKVKDVFFGGKKAGPYIKEKLKRETQKCDEFCRDGKKAEDAEKTCSDTCKKSKDLLQEEKSCKEKCREKCQGECTPEILLTLDPETKALCEACPKKGSEARKLAEECNRCKKRVEYLNYQSRQCNECDETLANLRKDVEKCKPNGAGCYARTDYETRAELEEHKKQKPTRNEGEKAEAFDARVDRWKKGVDRLEKGIANFEKRTAYAYSPPVKKPKMVPLKLAFTTGYKVSKSPGYFYVKDPSAGKPSIEKKTKRDDPTNHLGFWMMLAISVLIYFLGGMFTGRLSPGITMKEPATAGLFSGVVYFIFLLTIGAEFSVIIFSGAIGLVAFAGASYFGGWVGEKWQGTI